MFSKKHPIVSRHIVENVLKLGFPCGCHCYNNDRMETYKVFYTINNHHEHPRIINQIDIVCTNCHATRSFNIEDRKMTELDIKKLKF